MNTTKDLKVIQSSLQLLDDDKSEQLITLTYALFFKNCPQAEILWRVDDPVSRIKMFNGVILMVIDKLNRPTVYESNLNTDTREHHEYGVTSEMYVLFFRALIDSFVHVLSSDFSNEMKLTWERQFECIDQTIQKYISLKL